MDISKQSTRASYPADFKNYQRNSYFEISDNHPCFSCGVGTTGDAYLVLINSSENLYHVCASTRVVLLPIHNRFSHIHIVVTLQKDRHILVIDLKLLDLG